MILVISHYVSRILFTQFTFSLITRRAPSANGELKHFDTETRKEEGKGKRRKGRRCYIELWWEKVLERSQMGSYVMREEEPIVNEVN